MINGLLKILSIIGIIVWILLTILWLISCVLFIMPIILIIVGELWVFLLLFISIPLMGSERIDELISEIKKDE